MNFTWMFMLMMPVIVPYMKSFGLSREQVFNYKVAVKCDNVKFPIASPTAAPSPAVSYRPH